jgi:hypothetical protein
MTFDQTGGSRAAEPKSWFDKGESPASYHLFRVSWE